MNSNSTQVAFVRLDPILRLLLTLITQYRELPSDMFHQEERRLGILRAQVKILQQLQETIPEFDASSLIVMVDYITLPLTAIFHTTFITPTLPNDKSKEDIRKIQIRNSDIYKVQEETAKTISIYAKACHQKSNSSLLVTVPPAPVVKILIALATALPSGNPTIEYTNEKISSSSLEDGSSSQLAVVQAIQALCRIPSSPTLPADVAKALDGALMARLADVCSGLCQSPSIDLSVEAIRALECLFTTVPMVETVWQPIFPGVFGALYRCTMKAHRRRQGAHLVEQASLIALRRFLVFTLVPPSSPASKPPDDVTSILEKLQVLAVSTKEMVRNDDDDNNNNNNNNNETAKKSSAVSEQEDFLSRVNQRIVTPLLILLQQVVVSPSLEVRIETASLCRILLIETRDCWHKDSHRIFEVALECCLVLEQDTEGKI